MYIGVFFCRGVFLVTVFGSCDVFGGLSLFVL